VVPVAPHWMHTVCPLCSIDIIYLICHVCGATRTWPGANPFLAVLHSHVHNELTVPIIVARCIAHARNGRISTSGLKSDVTIVFLDPDFL